MNHQTVKLDLKGVAAFLNRLEDAFLVSILTAMLVLASAQILARNFFQAGILWGDILVWVMVLWVGLVGAMVAARRNQHISIDIVSLVACAVFTALTEASGATIVALGALLQDGYPERFSLGLVTTAGSPSGIGISALGPIQ